MHWLYFLCVWRYNIHPQRFCISEWIWLRCNFHLGYFFVHLLEFSWYEYLTGNLGGTSGGLLFWIFPLGISMPPCVNFLVWLLDLLVLDYVVHKLNIVRHQFLYLWRKFVAYWTVLGRNLLCLILFTLLFWGCMPYGIYSVPLMVLCTGHIIRVVPMMIYCLAYCELLFLYLVGLMACRCNWMIQIGWCRLIDG